MKVEKKLLTISLSASLYEDLQEAMKRAGSGDASEFISGVLRQHFDQAAENLDSEETKILKARLKGLGYI